VGVAVVAALAPAASALTFNGAGDVTDWGITPFPQTGSATGNHLGWTPSSPPYPTYWLEENNYASVNYPGSGHEPAPGGSSGERVDLEALYWRLNTGGAEDTLQVLMVSSMGDHVYWSSRHRHYRMGDLLIDVDGDDVYDFGIATTNWDDGGDEPWRAYDPATGDYDPFDHDAEPGTLYAISHGIDEAVTPDSDVVTIIGTQGGYGGNSSVEAAVRPWVVDQDPSKVGDPLGVVGLEKEHRSYDWREGGGWYLDDENRPDGVWRDEDCTWFYEWTIPTSLIDPDDLLDPTNVENLGLHMTIECGNDVIGHEGSPIEPQNGDVIPEPGTVGAAMLSIAGLGCYVRRRRKGGQSR
jgi:hypothetical protein